MIKRVFACLFVLLLPSCTLPGVSSQAISRVSPPLEPVGVYTLQGRPDFSVEQLSPEMQIWYARLWSGIEHANTTDSWINPEQLAASGDLYDIGRHLNVYVTTLLTTLRVTKDLALLDEVDRLMEMVRAELKDYNADGFLNWRYLNTEGDASTKPYIGDDYIVLDEVLVHSLIAAVAAAFHENAAFDARYEERASFWTDYLINEFEAKWRERNDVPFGLPFISRDLTHAYVQFIRYNYYMYEITGTAAYYSEASRMAELVAQHVKQVYTSGGPAYVWDHRFLPDTDASPLNCQPFVYLQYTFQAFQDMALEGFSIFDDTFMQHVSTSMTALVMDDSYRSFAKDICGGVFQVGLSPSSGPRGITHHFVNLSFSQVGRWDATGKVKRAVERAYQEIGAESERYTLSQFNLSAAMIFFLADSPDERRGS